jgi:hypothetical protein
MDSEVPCPRSVRCLSPSLVANCPERSVSNECGDLAAVRVEVRATYLLGFQESATVPQRIGNTRFDSSGKPVRRGWVRRLHYLPYTSGDMKTRSKGLTLAAKGTADSPRQRTCRNESTSLD